jgi:hypothetical protein
MVIVASHLVLDPEERQRYVASRRAVVEQAGSAPGCLDFAISWPAVDSPRRRAAIFPRDPIFHAAMEDQKDCALALVDGVAERSRGTRPGASSESDPMSYGSVKSPCG